MNEVNKRTMTPALESARLLRELHALFVVGEVDSKEADAIRDQMDGPWYAMTEQEQERMGGLSVDLYALAEGGPPRLAMNEQEIQAWQQEARLAFEQFDHGSVDSTLAFLRKPVPTALPPRLVLVLQAKCWEKLGDLETASFFMKVAEKYSGKAAFAIMTVPEIQQKLGEPHLAGI